MQSCFSFFVFNIYLRNSSFFSSSRLSNIQRSSSPSVFSIRSSSKDVSSYGKRWKHSFLRFWIEIGMSHENPNVSRTSGLITTLMLLKLGWSLNKWYAVCSVLLKGETIIIFKFGRKCSFDWHYEIPIYDRGASIKLGSV